MTRASTGSTSNKSFFSNERAVNILQDLLLQMLKNDLKIYLPGLGILFTKTRKEQVSYCRGAQTLSREEVRKEIQFEKSYEISAFHFEKFPNIIETNEIALRYIARLKKQTSSPCSLSFISKELKRFFNQIRSELITTGVSRKLGKVGTFFALKIKPELNWRDKFSLADICFVAETAQLVSTSENYRYETEILRSALQPLEKLYGEPQTIQEMALAKEIELLGYQDAGNEIEDVESANCKLGIFVTPSPTSKDEEHVIFCTDGLSASRLKNNKQFIGTELIVHTSIPKGSPLPSWPKRLLVIGWILLLSSQRKSLSPGTLVDFDLSDIYPGETNLSGILTAPSRSFPGIHLSLAGNFKYVTLLGLTQSEIDFATKICAKDLLVILHFKEHDQITKLQRRDIIG